MTVPTHLPTLSSGAHKPFEGKACVMEYVALLAGEPWTDSPSCTHPALAAAARRVNDSLPDSERHLLVPLIGRLFGTSEPEDRDEAKRLSVGLAIWSARKVLHLVREGDRQVCEDAILAAEAWVADPSDKNKRDAADAADADAAAAYAAAAYAAAYAAAAAKVELLSGLIDEYDRLTGRTEHRDVTDTDLSDLRQRVASLASN